MHFLWSAILLGLGPWLQEPTAQEAPRNVGRFSLSVDPDSLDPLKSTNTVNQVIQRQIFEGLAEPDPLARPFQVQALLAQSWEVSADGKQWTFEIREDASFYDPYEQPLWPDRRRPVYAEDVVYSWLRLMDKRSASSASFVLEDLIEGLDEFRQRTGRNEKEAQQAWKEAMAGGLPGLQVLGPRKLKVRLKRPSSDFLFRLASPYCVVYPREAVETEGRRLSDQPIGSGPFILVHWITKYQAILRQTPGWRGQVCPFDPERSLPHLQEVQFTFVPEGSTRVQMFRSGALDRLPPNGANYNSLVRDGKPVPELAEKGVRLLRQDPSGTSLLMINMDDPVLGHVPGDDVGNAKRRLLRKALALSFPYRRWHEVLRQGVLASSSRGLLPPGVPEADPNQDFGFRRPTRQQGVAEAKRLLTEAGYPQGKGLPALVLELQGTANIHKTMGDLIAHGWQEAGFKVQVQSNRYSEYLEKIGKGEAQCFTRGWYLDWPDSSVMLEMFYGPNASGGGINASRFLHPEYDRLFAEFRSMPHGPKRNQLAHRMQEILFQEVPAFSIDHPIGYQLVQPWLRNVAIHPYDFFVCKYFRIQQP
ncbi:MAG: hypothetical protein DWQ01_10620 [Planctomycetota bacterium]|nr:MAG: hypothetical protein DWQ01_10620 [Planctomycetota bacterium]